MPATGDVVVIAFAGAVSTKSRPAVIVSTDSYHRNRPDCILGILTTNLRAATTPLDHILEDWSSAGLYERSAFRSYFSMAEANGLRVIGALSARDLRAVRECLGRAFLSDGQA